jgi:hypothetical protein
MSQTNESLNVNDNATILAQLAALTVTMNRMVDKVDSIEARTNGTAIEEPQEEIPQYVDQDGTLTIDMVNESKLSLKISDGLHIVQFEKLKVVMLIC